MGSFAGDGGDTVVDVLWIVVPVACWLVTLYVFAGIFAAQAATVSTASPEGERRMVVLALRAALVVPVVATCALTALFFPLAFDGLEVASAVYEGYAVRCFLVLLIVNCGGPRRVVDLLRAGGGLPHWLRVANPRRAYVRICLAVWQFAYARPAFVLAESACRYAGAEKAAIAVSVGATISSLCMFPCLAYVVSATYDANRGLNVGWKFGVVKGVVAVILTEDAVQSFMYMYGVVTLRPGTLGWGTARDTEQERYVWLAAGIARRRRRARTAGGATRTRSRARTRPKSRTTTGSARRPGSTGATSSCSTAWT